MPTMAVIFGITLIAVGVFAYIEPGLFGTGKVLTNNGQIVVNDGMILREPPAAGAVTSLAPAAIGAIILLAGIVSIASPDSRKHAMHAAAMAALLGTIGGLVPVYMRQNDTLEAAVVVGWMMTLCSLFFLALCVNSFILARKEKEAGVVA